MAESSASGDSSPSASISQASRRRASSRVGTACPEAAMTTLVTALTNRSVHAGIGLRIADRVVDVEEHLGLGPRDGNAAVAAEGIKDAADELDLALADRALLPGLSDAQRAVAVDDGALDLLQGEARQADRRPARLVEHVDDEIEIRLARSILPSVAMRAISRLASSAVR